MIDVILLVAFVAVVVSVVTAAAVLSLSFTSEQKCYCSIAHFALVSFMKLMESRGLNQTTRRTAADWTCKLTGCILSASIFLFHYCVERNDLFEGIFPLPASAILSTPTCRALPFLKCSQRISLYTYTFPFVCPKRFSLTDSHFRGGCNSFLDSFQFSKPCSCI